MIEAGLSRVVDGGQEAVNATYLYRRRQDDMATSVDERAAWSHRSPPSRPIPAPGDGIIGALDDGSHI